LFLTTNQQVRYEKGTADKRGDELRCAAARVCDRLEKSVYRLRGNRDQYPLVNGNFRLIGPEIT